jgi:hypothetical protein
MAEHGGMFSGTSAWKQQEMQYTQQHMQMNLLHQLAGLSQASDAHDASKIKKLIFKDETFIFISHQMYQSVCSAPPNVQRAVVKRLHQFSRYSGSSKGCSALKAEQTGELAHNFEEIEGQLSAEENEPGAPAALTWQIQVRSMMGGVTWNDMQPDVQRRLNESIASGEPHPIVISVDGVPFEFDAYTGYAVPKDGAENDNFGDIFSDMGGMEHLGFARSICEQQRSLIRSVADPEDPTVAHSVQQMLKALALKDPQVLMKLANSGVDISKLLGGELKMQDEGAYAGQNMLEGFSHNEDDLTEEIDQDALKQLVEYGYSEAMGKKALQETAAMVSIYEDASSLALNWLLDNESTLDDDTLTQDSPKSAAADPAVWEVYLDDQGAWRPFDPSVSVVLENARSAGKSQVVTLIRGHQYTVQVNGPDDSMLKQRNEIYGTERPVRRRQLNPPAEVLEVADEAEAAQAAEEEQAVAQAAGGEWTCEICTCINARERLQCEACESPAPTEQTEQATCEASAPSVAEEEQLEQEPTDPAVTSPGRSAKRWMSVDLKTALEQAEQVSNVDVAVASAVNGSTDKYEFGVRHPLAVLSTQTNLSEETPQGLTRLLSEGDSGDAAFQVEEQGVCEVFESADGLVSTMNDDQTKQFLSNQPLWIRQLALHQSWSHRFEELNKAPSKLERVSSAQPSTSKASAPSSLRRAQSCAPEIGSFGGADGSTKDVRMRALHNLFVEDRSSAGWCPFRNI